jgi:phage-related protein
MNASNRPILFLGSSQKDLKKLPSDVRDVFAFGLDLASRGETPADAKILKGFGGASVLELKEDHKSDTYRAVYTVRFKKALYVLHVFKKKSTKGISTPKKDRDLIETRLKAASADNKERFG